MQDNFRQSGIPWNPADKPRPNVDRQILRRATQTIKYLYGASMSYLTRSVK